MQFSNRVQLNRIANVLCWAVCISLTGWANAAPDTDAPFQPGRTLVIDSHIEESNLDDLGKALVRWGLDANPAPADLIINSPGGVIMAGLAFINRMEAAKLKGLTIRCWVPDMAMSMAFSILLHCDERYTTPAAAFLFHRARSFINAPLTGVDAQTISSELLSLDQVLFKDIMAHLNMPYNSALYYFNIEAMHLAPQLQTRSPGFFDSIDENPIRVYEILDKLPGTEGYLRSSAKKKLSIFDLFKQSMEGQVPIYIYTGGNTLVPTNKVNNKVGTQRGKR